MRRRFRIVFLAAVTLGGCGTEVVYVPLVTPPRPLLARAPEQVDTFVATPPSRPHVDVGFLQVISHESGVGDPGTLQQMIVELRAAAAARGCDAVLITTVDSRRSRHSSSAVEGSCEVYTDGRVAPPPPPPAPVAPPAPRAAVVGNAGADVRTAPSLTAPVITRLNPGDFLKVLPGDHGWSFVKLADGRGGYVTDMSLQLQ